VTVIEIKPSRLLLVLVTGVHVVAAFSFCFSSGSWLWVAGAATAVLSWANFVLRWLRDGCRLGLMSDGGFQFDPDGAVELQLNARPETTVSAAAVWLVWQDERTRRKRARLVMRDQVSRDDWRRFQVWARLRAGRAAEG